MIAEIIVHEDEEGNFPKLREKLKEKGFILNDNFPLYIVPVKGTIIQRERVKGEIKITQVKS